MTRHLHLVNGGEPSLREAVKAAVEENRLALMRQSLKPFKRGTYYRRPGTELIHFLRDHPDLRELDGAPAAEPIRELLADLLESREIEDLTAGRGDEFMRACGDQDTTGATVRFDQEAFIARWDVRSEERR